MHAENTGSRIIHVPHLKLYASNRLERLAERLAVSIARSAAGPLESEVVVVSSRGMQRWLSLMVARHNGVCANVSFPFPHAFVMDVFARVLGGRKPDPRFERESMTLGIMSVLEGHGVRDVHPQLAAYLEGDGDGMRLYQLSAVTAELFDKYLVYRPDMVLGWEAGRTSGADPNEIWQKWLWTHLVEKGPGEHAARLRREFFGALPAVDASMLPGRVSVFGVGFLPPFYLEVLRALSHRIDVDVYCLNPCREYWGDIKSERRITRIAGREGAGDVELLHLEVGNGLLAAFGDLTGEFLDLVLEADPEQVDMFEDVDRGSMLGRIQSDMLDLVGPAGRDPEPVRAGDTSVQVHVCHSPMRELEVLKDVLLSLFEDMPHLTPADVCVMAPDIEPYVPLIHAVFDTDGRDPTYIPYSISDRSMRSSSLYADAVLRVLRLHATRLEASSVMDLLDKDAVRRRFGIGESDVAVVHDWVRDAGIRWGFDADHRARLGLPGYVENTWDHGVKRLLLGYAMDAQDGLFASMAPLAGVDPSKAELLGRFCDFVACVGRWIRVLEEPRDMAGWADVVLGLIEDFLEAGEDDAEDLLTFISVVRRLGRAAEVSGQRRKVSVSVFVHALERSMGRPAEGSGFLERGVTFCSMMPMRSVPFEVICLMGMNHDAFPRHDVASRLDLTAHGRRRGDRSLRSDDLSLFLETVVSARSVLCISYVGRGVQDNAERPPSVAVGTLLEYIDRAFATGDGSPASSLITRVHHLQAYNPRYFDREGGLFSYSRPNERAASALVSRPAPPHAPCDADGMPGENIAGVTVGTLCEFFRNPARYFLRRRLGVKPPGRDAGFPDVEPMKLDSLEKYTLRERVMSFLESGADGNGIYERLRAEGRLPHGSAGRLIFTEILDDATQVVNRLRQARGGEERRVLRVEVEAGGLVVSGDIEVWGRRAEVVWCRPADLTPADYLGAWLSLLALDAGGVATCGAHLVGLKKDDRLETPEDAPGLLRCLVEVFRLGLMRPIHLFPSSSYAFAEKLADGAGMDEALDEARERWLPGWNGRGESDDDSFRLLFAGADPFDKEFTDLSSRVFGPLLACMTRGRAA